MKIAFNPSTVAALTAPPNNKDIIFDLRGNNIFARGVKFLGTDTNTWRDIKINGESIGSHTLYLNNGKNTTLSNNNHGIVTINSTLRPVVNNLTSLSTTWSLSAKQGNVLAELINTLTNNVSNNYALRDGSNATGRWQGGLACLDIRNVNKNPGDLNQGLELHFLSNTTNGLKDGGTYNGVFSFRQWSFVQDWTGGEAHLLAFTDNGNMWHRTSALDSWGTWKKLAYTTDIPSSLKNPYALTISLNGISQGPYDGSAVKNINITPDSIGASASNHNHDYKYLKWLGNAEQANMNDIGRISHSSGMTELSDPGNTIDNPMEGNIKSTAWHLYWLTNYTDDPGGSNSWVALIVNKAGTDRWWVRSRSGGTITNGTNWASNWRFLVTAPTSGLGSSNLPIYINNAGEVVAANSYPTSLPANGGNADTVDGEHASNFVRAGHYESLDLNNLDTYSFIKSVYANNVSTSPNGHPGWYNVILAVHRNGAADGSNFIGQIALDMSASNNRMFYRIKDNGSWDNWKEVVTTNTGLLRYSRNNVNISSSNCSSIPPSLLEWTIGYPRLYDPEFNDGYNNVYAYNNANNGVVTVTRVSDTNVGNSSNIIIKVVSAPGAIPNYGGWHVATLTELGKVYTCLFRASVPSGVEINFGSNSIGTGGLWSWLTSYIGTGKWTWYAVLVYCGSEGSTTFFFSTMSPCTWYLSYVNVIENNRASYAGLRSVYSDYLKANTNIVFGRNELLYFNQNTSTTSGATNNANPTANWYHILRMNHANSNGYFTDLAIPFNDNRILFRRIVSGSDVGWYRVITEELNHNILLCDSSAGGNVGIGTSSPTQKLDVAGNIRTTGNLYISHATNNNMNYNTSNPRIVFSESGTLAVGLVYTNYDSYRASKGLKVMDVDNNDTGNVWFEVLGYNYSSGYVKNGSNDNYVLLGGGGHQTISSLSVNYASSAGNADTATNAYHLRIDSANTGSTWYWSGLSGQPSWLWGSNDGTNMYVWDPNNFNVHTALYLRSLGNLNCQTGRTLNYGDVYTYNTYDGNTGSLATYTSVIGFGRGIAGTVEIAGGWCNTGLYWRSLRDCCDDWYSWRTVLDSSNYIGFVNNYYWANVKISTSSSTTTSPTVHTLTATRVCAGYDSEIDNSISCSNWFRSSGNTGWYNATYLGGWYMSDTSWIRAHNNVGIYTGGQIYSSSSIKMGNILLEHTDEINNITNGGIYLNYRNSGNVSLCLGGGNVGIGTMSHTDYKLNVGGDVRMTSITLLAEDTLYYKQPICIACGYVYDGPEFGTNKRILKISCNRNARVELLDSNGKYRVWFPGIIEGKYNRQKMSLLVTGCPGGLDTRGVVKAVGMTGNYGNYLAINVWTSDDETLNSSSFYFALWSFAD